MTPVGPELEKASVTVAARRNRNGGGSSCEGCGVSLLKGAWGILPRGDQRFCSNACRQAGYRRRKREAKSAPEARGGVSVPDPPRDSAGAPFVFFAALEIQAARPGQGSDRYVYSLAGPEGWTAPRLARVLKAMQAAARESLDDDGGELV